MYGQLPSNFIFFFFFCCVKKKKMRFCVIKKQALVSQIKSTKKSAQYTKQKKYIWILGAGNPQLKASKAIELVNCTVPQFPSLNVYFVIAEVPEHWKENDVDVVPEPSFCTLHIPGTKYKFALYAYWHPCFIFIFAFFFCTVFWFQKQNKNNTKKHKKTTQPGLSVEVNSMTVDHKANTCCSFMWANI